MKKRKVKGLPQATRIPVPATQQDISLDSLPSGIQLVAVLLRQLQYNELDSPPNSLEIGKLTFTLNGSLAINPPFIAQVGMKADVISHTALNQAVGVQALLTATFRRSLEVSPTVFIEFVRMRSGPLLFPYLREVISAVTGRGVAGAQYLNPLVMDPLMSQEEAREYIALLSQENISVAASG